jgi:hypothetical protein
LHPQNKAIYALQLHPVRDILADSISALLVRLRPLHQQVEVAVADAERFCSCSKLCVLRLVGLAFFVAHCLHFVLFMGQRIAYQKGGNKKES